MANAPDARAGYFYISVCSGTNRQLHQWRTLGAGVGRILGGSLSPERCLRYTRRNDRARHPSQLYAAVLEGALLLAYSQWRFWRTGATRKPGTLSGEFLILYAVVRIIGEQFREPDASLILGMNQGVFYSLFMVAVGEKIMALSHRTSAVKGK